MIKYWNRFNNKLKKQFSQVLIVVLIACQLEKGPLRCQVTILWLMKIKTYD